MGMEHAAKLHYHLLLTERPALRSGFQRVSLLAHVEFSVSNLCHAATPGSRTHTKHSKTPHL